MPEPPCGRPSQRGDEAPGIQRALGIELLLERAHEPERGRRHRAPRIDARPQRGRAPLDHDAAAVAGHEGMVPFSDAGVAGGRRMRSVSYKPGRRGARYRR